MDGMTHRVQVPGKLVTFRWPAPSPGSLADSAFLPSLHFPHLHCSVFPPVRLPEKCGWGRTPVSYGLGRGACSRPIPAGLIWNLSLPAVSLSSYPSELPPALQPSTGGRRRPWRLEQARAQWGPGSWRCLHVTCSAWMLASCSGFLVFSLLTPTCCVTVGQSCPLSGPQFPFLTKKGAALDAPKAFSVLIHIRLSSFPSLFRVIGGMK